MQTQSLPVRNPSRPRPPPPERPREHPTGLPAPLQPTDARGPPVPRCMDRVPVFPLDPLNELKRWLDGLPAPARDSQAAGLLHRLLEAPRQTLAWHDWTVKQLFASSDDGWPVSVSECCALHAATLALLQGTPIQGQWTVLHAEEPSPGVRLAPGHLMTGYLPGRRPG